MGRQPRALARQGVVRTAKEAKSRSFFKLALSVDSGASPGDEATEKGSKPSAKSRKGLSHS
jgi:hypothetical protein